MRGEGEAGTDCWSTTSHRLWKQILHYATFPQTGVSLRQMVMFGQNPSQVSRYNEVRRARHVLTCFLYRRVHCYEPLNFLQVRRDSSSGEAGGLAGADQATHDTEELPIRLAHRVKELDALPNNLNKMPSIEKVKKWYAESFEVSSPACAPSALSEGNAHRLSCRNSSTSRDQSFRQRFMKLSSVLLKTLLLCPKLRPIPPSPST